jgi:hypothetical protein
VQAPKARWLKDPVVVAAIIAAIGGIVVAVITVRAGRPDVAPALRESIGAAPETGGRILAPTRGQHVARSFSAEGSLSGIPADRHVWLVVEIGSLMWPQEPEIPATDRRWSHALVEEGAPPGGRFGLALLMVDRRGNEEIGRWLEHGRRTGDYPGLAPIPNAVRLDVVTNLALPE